MTSQISNDWQKWLQENYPNVRALDNEWTMERYDYPQYVRDGIMENWTKVNDNNGGTWYEPVYLKKKYGTVDAARKAISGINNDITKTVDTKTVDDFEKFVNNVENKDDDGKSFATSYKDAGFDAGMDDANKKGIDIMEKDGMKAAIKYMFTDQDSGRQLSYGEMRMRYG